jgi:6,7-dimethyl-8-ribityllumazine synthase
MKLSTNPQLSQNYKFTKVAIILPYFNEEIGNELYENTIEELKNNGVTEKNIKLFRVYGALEIPFACQKIIKLNQYDVIITLGAIIKGETPHFDIVSKTTFDGIMTVQLKNNTPIIFGILTCNTLKQAQDRASKKGLNKGKDCAVAALMQTKI